MLDKHLTAKMCQEKVGTLTKMKLRDCFLHVCCVEVEVQCFLHVFLPLKGILHECVVTTAC